MPRIVIDPGHGGYDPGAIGPGGLKEKEVTLAVTKIIAEKLRVAGVEVRLTRDQDQVSWPDDLQKDLAARSQLANEWPADFFLSIHCNSAVNRKAQGTETYCYRFGGQGEKLARAIQHELIKANGLVDRGVKQANFSVLRKTLMPAVLVELAFISNPEEEKLLASRGFQERCAYAIAKGIVKFLGIEIKGESRMTEVVVKVKGKEIEGFIKDDRTYVPVKDIVEVLNNKVIWDGENRVVVIE